MLRATAERGPVLHEHPPAAAPQQYVEQWSRLPAGASGSAGLLDAALAWAPGNASGGQRRPASLFLVRGGWFARAVGRAVHWVATIRNNT